MSVELDYTFRAMGSDVRLLIGERLLPSAPPPLAAADRERAFVWEFSDRLSRFRANSDLSRLNESRSASVPASPLLRAAVAAGLWAAERSGGLVDPTLVGALERSGYDHSLDGVQPASLVDALAHAPPRRAAQPDPAARWRQVIVDEEAGRIVRPPGTMIDTGGTGKGLCADAVAVRLAGYARFVVDCGGDIAVGGVGAQLDPYEIAIEHPLTGESVGSIKVDRGGIATSGLNVRIWRRTDGELCPSPPRPVHRLAGVERPDRSNRTWRAVRSRPRRCRRWRCCRGPGGRVPSWLQHGGVIVHDSGEVEAIGSVADQLQTRVHEPLAR